jgi:RNase P subunit RPR2
MDPAVSTASAVVAAGSTTNNAAVVPSAAARRVALKGEDAWKRLNFLFHAAHSAVTLPHAQLGRNLSRVYLQDMRRVASKLVLRIDSSVKNTMCKRCGVLLVPGMTAITVVDEAGVREQHIANTSA